MTPDFVMRGLQLLCLGSKCFFGFVSEGRGEVFNSSKQSEQLCVNELPDWITFNAQVIPSHYCQIAFTNMSFHISRPHYTTNPV